MLAIEKKSREPGDSSNQPGNFLKSETFLKWNIYFKKLMLLKKANDWRWLSFDFLFLTDI